MSVFFIFGYQMTRTKFLPAIFILFLVMSACGASVSSEAEPKPTTAVDVIPAITPVKIPLTEAEVPRVTLEDAKVAFDNGTAIFVDVRSKDSFKAGHITGALLIQLGEFETRLEKIKLPKDQWIITYCT